MIKKAIFALFIALQTPLVAVTYEPSQAQVIGSSVGMGKTKSAAYAEALSNLPFGAKVYQKVEHRSPHQYIVTLYWKK